MRYSFQSLADRGKADAAEYNRLGAAAMQRRAYREASYYLLCAAVCNPDFWPALFNLGTCWARLNEREAAVWAYEQAVRHCDDHAPLFLNLGILLCEEGRFADALPYLEQALRLHPEGVSCLIALGYVCYRLGELGLSWHWYSKARLLAPGDKRVRDSLRLLGEKIRATSNRPEVL